MFKHALTFLSSSGFQTFINHNSLALLNILFLHKYSFGKFYLHKFLYSISIYYFVRIIFSINYISSLIHYFRCLFSSINFSCSLTRNCSCNKSCPFHYFIK